MDKTPLISVIGLGLVGKALARRFLAHGYRVIGYDIASQACQDARGLGVEVSPTARETAGVSSALLLSLPNSAVVDSVLWGKDGVGERLKTNTLVLDTTTARPEGTAAHHQRLRSRGIRFIDVTLVGSSQEIGEGKGVALVGDAEGEADYRDLLGILARQSFFFGAPGQGNRAKLIVNLVLGLNRLVLAEGLALAQRAGMDTATILEALRSSSAYSTVMDTKGRRMIEGDFEPVARLAQHAKDVDLILDLARAFDARTPLSELHAQLLREACDSGWGALDNSAVVKLFL